MAMSMFLFVPTNNAHTSVGGSCWMLGGRQNLCKTQRDRGCMSPARKNATEKIGSAFVRAPKTTHWNVAEDNALEGAYDGALEMYEGTTLRVNWAIERPELCRLHRQRSSDLGHTRTIVSTRTRMTKLEEATEIDADGLIGRKLDDHVGKFDNLSFDQFFFCSHGRCCFGMDTC